MKVFRIIPEDFFIFTGIFEDEKPEVRGRRSEVRMQSKLNCCEFRITLIIK
jgi:hypothetical protein